MAVAWAPHSSRIQSHPLDWPVGRLADMEDDEVGCGTGAVGEPPGHLPPQSSPSTRIHMWTHADMQTPAIAHHTQSNTHTQHNTTQHKINTQHKKSRTCTQAITHTCTGNHTFTHIHTHRNSARQLKDSIVCAGRGRSVEVRRPARQLFRLLDNMSPPPTLSQSTRT